MKPAPFEYYDPRTIEEALALLQQHGGEARILAGGQSLVPLMNFRLAAPAVVIDINRIAALSYIEEHGASIHIGALTRQRMIEFSPLIGRRVPLLAEATQLVGHLPTRSRGTLGGSLAHADPAAEYPCVAAALNAEMVLRSVEAERVVPAAEFFRGLMATAIRADEILTEVRLPVLAAHAGAAFEEFSLRDGDFALAGVAAVVAVDGARCRAARLAACGVGATPVRLREAEHMLEEQGVGENRLDAVADCAAATTEPSGDLHASAAYRRHLLRILTRRALQRAILRSRQSAN